MYQYFSNPFFVRVCSVEVVKYWKSDYSAVDFGIFVGFVDVKTNIPQCFVQTSLSY